METDNSEISESENELENSAMSADGSTNGNGEISVDDGSTNNGAMDNSVISGEESDSTAEDVNEETGNDGDETTVVGETQEVFPSRLPAQAPGKPTKKKQPAPTSRAGPASKKLPVQNVPKTGKSGKKMIKMKSNEEGRKKRHEAGRDYDSTYTRALYKVFKELCPDLNISGKSMSIMNSMCRDIFERITLEASRLCAMHKKRTLGAREIETAVKLLLTGAELSRHATSEGTKAMAKYNASKDADK